jgi:hypothetical protein
MIAHAVRAFEDGFRKTKVSFQGGDLMASRDRDLKDSETFGARITQREHLKHPRTAQDRCGRVAVTTLVEKL